VDDAAQLELYWMRLGVTWQNRPKQLAANGITV